MEMVSRREVEDFAESGSQIWERANREEREKIDRWDGAGQTRDSDDYGGGARNYDVFLSFRGEETRHSFTDHLRDALVREGIRVFRDDEDLRRGTEIATGLFEAIKSSRISLVVFSEGYTSSRWCLDELVEILECRNTIGNTVIPIFYGVNPAEVRHQIGSYGKALAGHESRPGSLNERHQMKVNAWRNALKEASFLSGEHLQDGSETKLISKIVNDVLSVTCPKLLHVANHPVGLEPRMEDIRSFHDSTGSDEVRMIGIHGMGGIGKTVIAKSLYNQNVENFDYGCFLGNVRDESKLPEGLVGLQKHLLSVVHIKTEIFEISNVHFGKNMIKERCCSKKILLLIDDADKIEQISSFVGERSWFGPGSRIIITTRDEHLLRLVGVDETYQATVLNENDSMDLFTFHAFKHSVNIPAHYVELSRIVVNYAGGLPLALEVLGSFLKTRRTHEWQSAIAKLRQIPHDDIQEKLRISYDSLADDHLKETFLHIACFFIGMNIYDVIDIIEGCGFHPDIEFEILKERSLITVDGRSNLGMHDLLRDMGREIVRQESPGEPGRRSRLWSGQEVRDVLENFKGTESVKGIAFIQPSNGKLKFPVEAFESMYNLRLLHMENISLTRSFSQNLKNLFGVTGMYDHLSKELRWIYWPFYDLENLLPNLCLQSLVTLDMQCSEIRVIWKGHKSLRNLKTINLCYSKSLKETPDLSGSPMLEKLLLEGCLSLSVVHISIGNLTNLTHLNLKDCPKLRHLPSCVYNLRSLQHFDTHGCINLVQEETQSPLFSSFGQGSNQPFFPPPMRDRSFVTFQAVFTILGHFSTLIYRK